jgi:hypothetical protein
MNLPLLPSGLPASLFQPLQKEEGTYVLTLGIALVLVTYFSIFPLV